jgi:catechol 2,3-dioxygenase-like lactoylglutathione lyase family enzyme
MTDHPTPKPETWARLVPELACADVKASIDFYVSLLGFRIRFERPESGFAYLEKDGAELMLEQAGGHWSTGELEQPYGRGINFQIDADDAPEIAARLAAAGWPLFRPLHENWYRAGDIENGQREFLVQDPDGYLLRFAQWLGDRPYRGGPR